MMNRRQALKATIDQWTGALDDERHPKRETLCALYLSRDCKGCPVADYTGTIFCIGTPFNHEAFVDYMAAKQAKGPSELLASIALREARRQWVEFLQEVLEHETMQEAGRAAFEQYWAKSPTAREWDGVSFDEKSREFWVNVAKAVRRVLET